MKCSLLGFASIILALLPQGIIAQQATEYFPLHVGNYWIQQADSVGGMSIQYTYRREVEGIDSIGGKEYFRVHESIGATDSVLESGWFTWVGVDSIGGGLIAFGNVGNVDSATIFDPPLYGFPSGPVVLNDTWQFEATAMGGTFSFLVEDTAATVVVPAGTFMNCLQLRLTISSDGDTSQVGHHYHAAGVGEVLNVGTNAWLGNYRFELREYFVQPLVVREENLGLPARIQLHPNYPNPFNPVSTIRYELPLGSDVSLVIYDILGREVARLVQGEQAAGYHQVVWDGRAATGREVPSGIYIARLVTGEYSKAIKMVFLK